MKKIILLLCVCTFACGLSSCLIYLPLTFSIGTDAATLEQKNRMYELQYEAAIAYNYGSYEQAAKLYDSAAAQAKSLALQEDYENWTYSALTAKLEDRQYKNTIDDATFFETSVGKPSEHTIDAKFVKSVAYSRLKQFDMSIAAARQYVSEIKQTGISDPAASLLLARNYTLMNKPDSAFIELQAVNSLPDSVLKNVRTQLIAETAHAYLFAGKLDSALTLYPKQSTSTNANHIPGLVKMVIQDFRAFREMGIVNPYFTKIERTMLPTGMFVSVEAALESPLECTTLSLREANLLLLSEDIKRCENLETIDLGWNPNLQFEAVFKILSSLPKLRTVGLTSNKLTGLPAMLTKCKSVSKIILDINPTLNLDDVFTKFADMENLNDVSLWFCGIKTLPTSIEDCKQLKTINLNSNKTMYWEGAMRRLEKLPKLRSLSLASNFLKTLPYGIVLLTNLEELDCRANRLVVDADYWQKDVAKLAKLKKLTTLVLDANAASLIAKEETRKPSLEEHMQRASFKELPGIEQVQSLEMLYVRNTAISLAEMQRIKTALPKCTIVKE